MAKRDLAERVADAAIRALNQKHVSPVDVLIGMGMLHQIHFEQWQRGQVPNLESSIQCGVRKLDDTMKLFLTWATGRGLKPHPSSYKMQGRGGETRQLQVSASGDPEIERVFTCALGVAGASREKTAKGDREGRRSERDRGFLDVAGFQVQRVPGGSAQRKLPDDGKRRSAMSGVRGPGSPGIPGSGRRR